MERLGEMLEGREGRTERRRAKRLRDRLGEMLEGRGCGGEEREGERETS